MISGPNRSPHSAVESARRCESTWLIWACYPALLRIAKPEEALPQTDMTSGMIGPVDAKDARNRLDGRPHDPPGTLAPHHSDCFRHVHYRLYRPDQHLHGSALDEPGIAHDPHPGRQRGGDLLLGLSVAANSRW